MVGRSSPEAVVKPHPTRISSACHGSTMGYSAMNRDSVEFNVKSTIHGLFLKHLGRRINDGAKLLYRYLYRGKS